MTEELTWPEAFLLASAIFSVVGFWFGVYYFVSKK